MSVVLSPPLLPLPSSFPSRVCLCVCVPVLIAVPFLPTVPNPPLPALLCHIVKKGITPSHSTRHTHTHTQVGGGSTHRWAQSVHKAEENAEWSGAHTHTSRSVGEACEFGLVAHLSQFGL